MIFAQSGEYVKPIVFTHSDTTEGKPNKLLKHNVDPNDPKPCYGVPYRGVRKSSEFKSPKGNYRIHNEDAETIKMLKSEKRKK